MPDKEKDIVGYSLPEKKGDPKMNELALGKKKGKKKGVISNLQLACTTPTDGWTTSSRFRKIEQVNM